MQHYIRIQKSKKKLYSVFKISLLSLLKCAGKVGTKNYGWERGGETLYRQKLTSMYSNGTLLLLI